MLTHDLHPRRQARRAERLVRLIGIKRRQFPEGLLPPHAADHQAEDPIPDVSGCALFGHRAVDVCRDCTTTNQQKPKDHGSKPRLEEESDDIAQRIGGHLWSFLLRVRGRKAASREKVATSPLLGNFRLVIILMQKISWAPDGRAGEVWWSSPLADTGDRPCPPTPILPRSRSAPTRSSSPLS